jgi:hypothetical protein
MLKLKKIWLFLLGIIVVLWFNFQFTNWLWSLERDHDDDGRWSHGDERDSTAIMSWEVVSATDSIWSWSKVMWDKSVWIVHLPQAENYDTELWYALSIIQITVNWILWILAFVVSVYMLYNWFLVLSAWSDDKNVAKGKKWISTAAIAIAWIGLAWLIISAMIRFIKNITQRD